MKMNMGKKCILKVLESLQSNCYVPDVCSWKSNFNIVVVFVTGKKT